MSAMQISVSREGLRALARINEHAELTEKTIRRVWFELGKELKQTANREILARDKLGRVYIIRGPGGRRRRHVASAPGQSHANRSGRLRRSISWRIKGHESLAFGYGVSTTAGDAAPDYDAFVEFGTRNMAARPSLLNAIETSASRRVEVDFGDFIMQAFRVLR